MTLTSLVVVLLGAVWLNFGYRSHGGRFCSRCFAQMEVLEIGIASSSKSRLAIWRSTSLSVDGPRAMLIALGDAHRHDANGAGLGFTIAGPGDHHLIAEGTIPEVNGFVAALLRDDQFADFVAERVDSGVVSANELRKWLAVPTGDLSRFSETPAGQRTLASVQALFEEFVGHAVDVPSVWQDRLPF